MPESLKPAWRAPLALVVLSALALAACAASGGAATTKAPATPTSLTLSGKVIIKPEASIIGVGGYYEEGQSCDGAAAITGQDDVTRRYFEKADADLVAGDRISVTDAEGKVVGVGSLGQGRWLAQPRSDSNLDDHLCVMPWQVSVKESEFYGINLGARPPSQYAKSEMASGNLEIMIDGGKGELSWDPPAWMQ